MQAAGGAHPPATAVQTCSPWRRSRCVTSDPVEVLDPADRDRTQLGGRSINRKGEAGSARRRGDIPDRAGLAGRWNSSSRPSAPGWST